MDKKTLYMSTHKVLEADHLKFQVNEFDSALIDLWIRNGNSLNYTLVATLRESDQDRLIDFIESIREDI